MKGRAVGAGVLMRNQQQVPDLLIGFPSELHLRVVSVT